MDGPKGVGVVRWMRWATYLWPGLPQLMRGSWAGLAVAVGLATLLCGALVASFGWDELFSLGVRKVIWMSLGGVWLILLVVWPSWDRQAEFAQVQDAEQDDFNQALEHYLQGNWFQAERLLQKCLQANDHDLDARLMRATLCRHTGRLEEAADELDLIQRLEGSQKWEWEIGRERALLAQAQSQDNEENETMPGWDKSGQSARVSLTAMKHPTEG